MKFLKFLVSKTLALHLVLGALFIVLVVFGLLKWLDTTTNHSQKIEVPSLKGMSVREAHRALQEVDLRWVILDSSNYLPQFPKKSIIAQNPKAGDLVKEKRKIYLTLNKSRFKNVSVPEFYGKTRKEVEAQLKSIGFKIGHISYIPDLGKDVVRGLICNSQIVEPYDQLQKHSTIDLVLGNGRGE